MKNTFLKKIGMIVFIFLILTFFSSRLYQQASASSETCNLSFSSGVELLNIPVAKTSLQQSKGLSRIKQPGNGLFFVWEKSEPRAFWMRKTYFPLSVGFFAEDGMLFSIQDMQPQTKKYYLSMMPAQYGLELSQGAFKQKGINVGDTLSHFECHPQKS